MDLGCGSAFVKEPGQVFFAADPSGFAPGLEQMLQPIFLQIPRRGHAERRAMLAVLRKAASRIGEEAWGRVCGRLLLYVSHYPCISCLVVFAQMSRHLPKVRLVVDFDD